MDYNCDIKEYVETVLARPGSWMAFDDLGQYETHARVLTVHRDSCALDRSNWTVISKELLEMPDSDNPDEIADVYDARSSHWAVGWIDELFVRVYDAQGNLTPQIHRAFEWFVKLSDYPVADESHFSEVETEEFFDTLTNCWDIPKDRLEDVCSWLYNEGNISTPEELTDNRVQEALTALGIEGNT